MVNSLYVGSFRKVIPLLVNLGPRQRRVWNPILDCRTTELLLYLRRETEQRLLECSKNNKRNGETELFLSTEWNAALKLPNVLIVVLLTFTRNNASEEMRVWQAGSSMPVVSGDWLTVKRVTPLSHCKVLRLPHQRQKRNLMFLIQILHQSTRRWLVLGVPYAPFKCYVFR